MKKLFFIIALLLFCGHANAQGFLSQAVVPASAYPCDILATAGTPCKAAYSTSRSMFRNYFGNLFQLTRLSDLTTLNVGVLPSGIVNASGIASFCSGTYCHFSNLYDQAGNGNNLPQATFTTMPNLVLGSTSVGTMPIVSAYTWTYLRNRTSTSGVPTGNAPLTEYMVIDTRNAAGCCGTFGEVGTSVSDMGNGTMFSLAYSFGGGGVFGNGGVGSGPWAGVDWENGVFLYGPAGLPQLTTILGKYTNSSSWAVEHAAVTSAAPTIDYSGSLPGGYSANWKGGLSLGEGGDGSAAPVNFIEGAVIAGSTSAATDAALFQSIGGFYQSATIPAYTAPTCAANISSSLVSNALSLTNASWTVTNASVAGGVGDPFSGTNAATVTGNGNSNQGLSQAVTLSANTYYTIIIYTPVTSGATRFPVGGVSTNASGTPAYSWLINTNTGQTIGTDFNNGEITQVSAVNYNGWWQIKMVFLTHAGTTSGTFSFGPQIASVFGLVGATAGANTFYCPIIVPGFL